MPLLQNIWKNLSNFEAFLSIFVMLISGFIGIKSILKHRNVNRSLRKWLAKDTIKSMNLYIDTRGQQIDPCNYDEICDASKCAITQKLIPFFIKEVFPNGIQNQYFILLGDSGTGKTTFMIQLYKAYWKKIWKKYKIEFVPLLHKGCANEITAINNPENTILLLDGLDENADAMDNYENFMSNLLEKAELFYKVIITCRTQFFPNEKAEPFETGRISFDLNHKKTYFKKSIYHLLMIRILDFF